MKDVAAAFAGKRVLVSGMDAALTADLTEIFRSAGATTVASGDADLLVASPAASSHADPSRPLLVVGPLADLPQGRPAEHFDFVIAPPLRGDEVLLRGFRLLTGSRQTAAGDTPTVLAVDDDATTTAIVRAVVTRNGMTCHVATNGRQALESAKAIKPSLIVLDVNMPYIDGFEVLATLQNDSETAHIPVMMLTSVQQESDIVRGFGLGAADYVVKPFNPMELLARIKRLVRKD
ncbi:MAG TPA: response regulator [Thermoanaerobaculia bacterium]|nr:response regulator [Thermoanaerobaculia bacterium]